VSGCDRSQTKASDGPTPYANESDGHLCDPTTLFRGGLLFKPHGRLLLTLLTIFIDIATW
jgi:hypothetical protein